MSAPAILTVRVRLTPERVSDDEGDRDEHERTDHLTEVVVEPGSPLVGQTVAAVFSRTDAPETDVDVVRLVRGSRTLGEPPARDAPGWRLRLQAPRDTVSEAAAPTAFIWPVEGQTTLFVYGPGGHRFPDYLRVGAPLLALLS